jgi:large subunit ribosomal protein L23
MRLDQIIIKPLLSEKSAAGAKLDRYCFKVNRLSNKYQIKVAIEQIFKVKVVKVRTINLIGKIRRSTTNRRLFKTSDFKKAIVELKKGDKINLFETESSKKTVKSKLKKK